MKPFLYTYLFFFIGFFSTVQAQQNQVYFEKHDVKSGLPESTVRDMVEDQLGYIWMATQNGLVRYDGYNYKVYQLGTKKTNLDPISNVQTIYLDKNNILWVSTNANGLFKYNRTNDTFTQYSYPEKDLAALYTIYTDDKEGNLWGFVTKDWETSYLWKLDKEGKLEFFGKPFKKTNYVNASRFYSAFTSQSGKVWFGSNNGFYSYEGKNKPLKGYSTSNNPVQTKEVAYLYEAPSEPNIFWMVSYRGNAKDNKFVRFDAKANTYTSYNHNSNGASPLNYENLDLGFVRSIFYKGIHEDKKKTIVVYGL